MRHQCGVQPFVNAGRDGSGGSRDIPERVDGERFSGLTAAAPELLEDDDDAFFDEVLDGIEAPIAHRACLLNASGAPTGPSGIAVNMVMLSSAPQS